MSEQSNNIARPLLRRRFLLAGGRRWHLRFAGSGPALVLIHGSPGNSLLLQPLAERLARFFTVYAFDSPGFGDSAPLPGDPLSVAELADAYRDALDGAGLTRVALFGTHTGAAIGLELARRHPSRVSGFVLEGVPIFTPAEQAPLLTPEYMPFFDADVLGGHYARTWTRFHDQFLWFPWNERDPGHLNEASAGTAEDIHKWVTMYFQASHQYRPAYRAAIAYGAEAIDAAAEVRVPGVYLAASSDMLFPHLDRLPKPAADQRIERVASDQSVTERIELALRSLPAAGPAGALPASVPGIIEGFCDLPHGQIQYRSAGAGQATPLLILHDAPGSGSRCEDLFRSTSLQRRVILPDLPGCGESDALGAEQPSLADYADVVARLIGDCGEHTVDVYGIGFGAALALELNRRNPALVGAIRLTGLLRDRGATRAALIGRLAPPITLQADGSHWYRTWLMLRDSLVHWPWYDRHPASLRRTAASFDPELLHRWTCDVMRQSQAYHHLIEAVLAWDPGESLSLAAGKITVCIDPTHALAASDADLAKTLGLACGRHGD